MKKMQHLLGLVLLLCSFTALAQPKYFIFEENKKQGLVDLQGETVLAPTFNSIEEKYPYYLACSETECFVYNENLQLIFKGAYNFIKLGCKGQFIVKKDKKYGVVSQKGTEIFPLKYSFIEPNENGYTVSLDKKAGLFTSEGKEVIPISYNSVYTTKIDKNIPIVANLDGKEGYINTKNKWVIPPTYQKAFPFKQGLAKVQKEGTKHYMYINLKGEPVIQDFYTDMFDPSDNANIVTVLLRENNECKYKVYDFKGNLLGTYDDFRKNRTGNAVFAVKKNSKWGYIDVNGKVVIPLEYEEVADFSEGLAPVCKNGKWGYINLKKEVVIPFKFANSKMYSFKNGVARYCYTGGNSLYSDDVNGLINLKGEIIVEPKYKSIEYINGNVAMVSFDGYNYLYDFVREKQLKRLKKALLCGGCIFADSECEFYEIFE